MEAQERNTRLDQYKPGRAPPISSPKLRDMLREKCRIRIRESRANVFALNRNSQDDQSLALGFLKSEISELEADIEKQEAIVAEIMEEADQWLYEQMEAVEMMQIESLEQNSGIFCPVCRKSVLTQTTDSIIGCACGLKFAFSPGLEILHGNILRKVEDHEAVCNSELQFFSEPSISSDFSSLHALCNECEYFSTLII